jgi:NAD-dependent SIR2 family protein deacetylase
MVSLPFAPPSRRSTSTQESSTAESSNAESTSEAQLDAAVEILRNRSFAVLTGAGISTDSGIPDYRGEGAPRRKPMTFQQFSSDAQFRKRYWAGSHLGWRHFDAARPNVGHHVLSELERDGHVNGVITQNVDGLHLRAGSQRVVDLHGTMDKVRCLNCGQSFSRVDIAARISETNPWLDALATAELNPDGDAHVSAYDDFITPDCSVCDGMLKPDIVFFGEFIPTEKFTEAAALVRLAGALVVAGSSLVVNSGIRLIEQATRRKIPLIVINRGVTKGDTRAAVKIDAGTSETLLLLQERLASSA